MREIGYWTAPWARGQGVMTDAARLVCRFGFDVLGLERIEWWAGVGNDACWRVAEKLGFTREGTCRCRLLHRGERLDGWVGGLLPGSCADGRGRAGRGARAARRRRAAVAVGGGPTCPGSSSWRTTSAGTGRGRWPTSARSTTRGGGSPSAAAPDRIDWAVRDPATGHLIGRTGLHRFEEHPPRPRSATACTRPTAAAAWRSPPPEPSLDYAFSASGLDPGGAGPRRRQRRVLRRRDPQRLRPRGGRAGRAGLPRRPGRDQHRHARLAADPPGPADPPPAPLDVPRCSRPTACCCARGATTTPRVPARPSSTRRPRGGPRPTAPTTRRRPPPDRARAPAGRRGQAVAWAVEVGRQRRRVGRAARGQPGRPWATASYWVPPEARGRGVATRALAAAARYAFDVLGLHRVSCSTPWPTSRPAGSRTRPASRWRRSSGSPACWPRASSTSTSTCGWRATGDRDRARRDRGRCLAAAAAVARRGRRRAGDAHRPAHRAVEPGAERRRPGQCPGLVRARSRLVGRHARHVLGAGGDHRAAGRQRLVVAGRPGRPADGRDRLPDRAVGARPRASRRPRWAR